VIQDRMDTLDFDQQTEDLDRGRALEAVGLR
jgi:hypothetical protein